MRFYEKPGCAGNARQKKMLERAGVELEVRDLLSEPWSDVRLMEFFEGVPVPAWFNPNAPDVKSGAIDVNSLDKEAALTRLIAEPILIKRPLIEYKGESILGFDLSRIQRLVPALGRFQPVDPGGCTGSDRCV